MFKEEDDDLVGFSFGTKNGNYDAAIKSNGMNYFKMNDADSIRLKQLYYAVILHGWVNSVTASTTEHISFDPKQLVVNIKESYQKKGKNRAIILLSCFTGMGFSRKLVSEIKLPVLAPRSTCYVNPIGGIVSDESSNEFRNPIEQTFIRGGIAINKRAVLGYQVPNRPDWVFNHPNGNVEVVAGGSYLNKKAAIKLAEKYITGR